MRVWIGRQNLVKLAYEMALGVVWLLASIQLLQSNLGAWTASLSILLAILIAYVVMLSHTAPKVLVKCIGGVFWLNLLISLFLS